MKDMMRALLVAGGLAAVVLSEAHSGSTGGVLTFPYEEEAPTTPMSLAAVKGPVLDFPYDTNVMAAVQAKPAVVESKKVVEPQKNSTPATLAKPKAVATAKAKNVSLASTKNKTNSLPKIPLAAEYLKVAPKAAAMPAVPVVATAAAAKVAVAVMGPAPAPGGAPGPAPGPAKPPTAIEKHTMAARGSAAEAQKHLESARHAFDITKGNVDTILKTVPKIQNAAADVVHLYKPPAPAPTPAPKTTTAKPKEESGAKAHASTALAVLAVLAAVARQ